MNFVTALKASRSGAVYASLLLGLTTSAQAKDYAVFLETGANCLTTQLTSEANKDARESLASEALALVLPGIVEPLISGVGSLLEEAGAERTIWTRKDTSTQYFYNSDTHGDVNDFKLGFTEGAQCLTIIAGEINSDGAPQNPPAAEPFFNDRTVVQEKAQPAAKTLATYLTETYGFKNHPFAYLEFQVAPISTSSFADLTAVDGWTLEPLNAFVARRKSAAPNQNTYESKNALSLIVDFSTPGPNNTAQSFAQWTYDLSKLQGGVSWQRDKQPGQPAPTALHNLPIHPPNLDTKSQALVTEILALQAQKQEAGNQRLAVQAGKDARIKACKKYTGDSGASDQAACEPLKEELAALSIEMDTKVAAARKALAVAKAKNANNLAQLQAELDFARQEKMNAIKLAKLNTLTDGAYTAGLNAQLAAANGSRIEARYAALNARANRGLLLTSVTATVIASQEARPVLQAIGKALSDKSTELTTLITDELLPTKEDPAAAIQTETEVKVAALTKIASFETAKRTALAADATEAQKLTAESELLKAQASCDVLKLQGYTLEACARLPASFVSVAQDAD